MSKQMPLEWLITRADVATHISDRPLPIPLILLSTFIPTLLDLHHSPTIARLSPSYPPKTPISSSLLQAVFHRDTHRVDFIPPRFIRYNTAVETPPDMPVTLEDILAAVDSLRSEVAAVKDAQQDMRMVLTKVSDKVEEVLAAVTAGSEVRSASAGVLDQGRVAARTVDPTDEQDHVPSSPSAAEAVALPPAAQPTAAPAQSRVANGNTPSVGVASPVAPSSPFLDILDSAPSPAASDYFAAKPVPGVAAVEYMEAVEAKALTAAPADIFPPSATSILADFEDDSSDKSLSHTGTLATSSIARPISKSTRATSLPGSIPKAPRKVRIDTRTPCARYNAGRACGDADDICELGQVHVCDTCGLDNHRHCDGKSKRAPTTAKAPRKRKIAEAKETRPDDLDEMTLMSKKGSPAKKPRRK